MSGFKSLYIEPLVQDNVSLSIQTFLCRGFAFCFKVMPNVVIFRCTWHSWDSVCPFCNCAIQISENETQLTSDFLLKFTMHLSDCSFRIYRAKSQTTTKNTLQMQILFFRNDKAKVPENRDVIDSVLSVTLLRKVPETENATNSVLFRFTRKKVPEDKKRYRFCSF